MEDSFYLSDCGDNDVVSFEDATFKVGKFRKAVNKSDAYKMGSTLIEQLRYQGIVISNNYADDCSAWFGNGRNCEILNLGSKSWKQGKVRIKFSVELYVEEEAVETPSRDKPEIAQPESLLDDIRRMMTENK